MKDVGQWIRYLPAQRQIRLNGKLARPPHKRTKQELNQTLGCCIGADAGIEISRRLVERNNDRSRLIRFSARAGWQQDEQENQDDDHASHYSECIPPVSGGVVTNDEASQVGRAGVVRHTEIVEHS